MLSQAEVFFDSGQRGRFLLAGREVNDDENRRREDDASENFLIAELRRSLLELPEISSNL